MDTSNIADSFRLSETRVDVLASYHAYSHVRHELSLHQLSRRQVLPLNPIFTSNDFLTPQVRLPGTEMQFWMH